MSDNAVAFIVDDIAVNRELLESLVASVGIEAASFASAREFLDGFDRDRIGCILLDVRMPNMSGLELQKELARQRVDLPVIIVTAHSDVHMAIQAMKAGAFDFVEKPFNKQQVLDLVQRAIEVSRSQRTAAAELNKIRSRHEQLTERELDVLNLIMDGQLNKQIAHELGISQRTVEVHRANVMEKMGAKSLADLVKQIMYLRSST
jgi:two-component system response regulator FixJ